MDWFDARVERLFVRHQTPRREQTAYQSPVASGQVLVDSDGGTATGAHRPPVEGRTASDTPRHLGTASEARCRLARNAYQGPFVDHFPRFTAIEI